MGGRGKKSPCPYQKLDPAVLVMEATEYRSRYDPTEPLDRATDWNVLAQRQMSARLIVVGNICLQSLSQVGFLKDDHMFEKTRARNNRSFVGRLAGSRGGEVSGNLGKVDAVEDRH